jgi:hypothetical protein
MLTSDQYVEQREDAAVLREDGWAAPELAAERAAKKALRGQIGRLERELSGLVAGRFPHVGTLTDAPGKGVPHLLTIGELECLRDSLAARIREAQGHLKRRDQLETRAHQLLERMRAEPARYKFVRLPVTDLGERGCGVWEVRPRLGLIGMLAGWWQLKLSSGCPLAEGPRARRGPLPLRAGAVRAQPRSSRLALVLAESAQPTSSAGSRSSSRRPAPSIVASVRR